MPHTVTRVFRAKIQLIRALILAYFQFHHHQKRTRVRSFTPRVPEDVSTKVAANAASRGAPLRHSDLPESSVAAAVASAAVITLAELQAARQLAPRVSDLELSAAPSAARRSNAGRGAATVLAAAAALQLRVDDVGELVDVDQRQLPEPPVAVHLAAPLDEPQQLRALVLRRQRDAAERDALPAPSSVQLADARGIRSCKRRGMGRAARTKILAAKKRFHEV